MKQEMLDFNFLSKNGLIYEINKKILHQYGLALMRNTDGTSPGILADTQDYKFEYSDDIETRNIEKLNEFKKNSTNIIKEEISKNE